jgi:hypothetical protein
LEFHDPCFYFDCFFRPDEDFYYDYGYDEDFYYDCCHSCDSDVVV